MRKFILFLLIPFTLFFQETQSQNAPITTAGTITTYASTTILPITATGFNNIGSINLVLLYDPAVLTATSVTKGSVFGFSGTLNYSLVNPGIVSLQCYFFPGASIPDNSVTFNISFDKVTEGFSTISFVNDPDLCKYYNGSVVLLNDLPTSTYYIDGSITLLANTQWTGAVSDDWSDAANWSGESPSEYRNANIPDVDPDFDPVISGAEVCRELDLGAGATLTINASATLTAKGDFNNNGELIIKSTPAGSGSFIDNGVITGTGTATVERYLLQNQWHYVSSPIADGLSAIYSNIYLKAYIENLGVWSYIIEEDELLEPMMGYAAWASSALTGSTTVEYAGELNTGTQSSAVLTQTTGFTSSGYNMVGNPYPSAVDWDAVSGWSKWHLDNAIYIYNGNNGNYGSYVNGIPVNGVSNHIPSGQGFFVKVSTGETTGSLTVNMDAREHNSQPFLKNTQNEIVDQLLRLKSSSSMNAYNDEAILTFNPESTLDFDKQFDAYKLDGAEEAPQLYTVTPEQAKLSVNSFPKENDVVVIPLNFSAGVDGIYSIEANEILNFENATEIILEDKMDNVFVNLKEQNTYNFFVNAADDPERFNVYFHFNPSGIEAQLDLSNYHIYSNHHSIVLESLNGNDISGNIEVYSLLGQRIMAQSIQSGDHYKFDIRKEGIYLVTYFDDLEKNLYVQKVQIQ